jgi:hypothetical protein
MVDQRFSSSAFESCGLDSDEARKLADLLAIEVEMEMQEAVKTKLSAIVGRLNEMGHNLKPEQIALGVLSYRDDYEDAQRYHCKLRVAVDVIISTGYAHLTSSDPLDQNNG